MQRGWAKYQVVAILVVTQPLLSIYFLRHYAWRHQQFLPSLGPVVYNGSAVESQLRSAPVQRQDQDHVPESKVHRAYMGPTWGRQDPGGPHVGPMNLAIRERWRAVIPKDVNEFYGSNNTSYEDTVRCDFGNLVNDTTLYLWKFGDAKCFLYGTNIDISKKKQTCICKPGWHGQWCSFPSAVAITNSISTNKLTLRQTPRRVVYAVPFNMEFDILEAFVNELADAVSIFQILESNFTKYGDRKERHLYKALQLGFLRRFRSQIVYVKLNTYPANGREFGWEAEAHWFDSHGQLGFRDHISGARDDDIFIMTDVDEMVSKDIVYFLKCHDGFYEPFSLSLFNRGFGFFWTAPLMPTVTIFGGCTVAMLRDVLQYQTRRLRSPPRHIPRYPHLILAYHHPTTRVARRYKWVLGNEAHPVGWHCSWCLPPEHIVIKLLSGINADFPRWGDYPDRRKLPYIKNIIRKGIYFDNKSQFIPVLSSDPHFAPRYIQDHWQQYRYLLENNVTGANMEKGKYASRKNDVIRQYAINKATSNKTRKTNHNQRKYIGILKKNGLIPQHLSNKSTRNNVRKIPHKGRRNKTSTLKKKISSKRASNVELPGLIRYDRTTHHKITKGWSP